MGVRHAYPCGKRCLELVDQPATGWLGSLAATVLWTLSHGSRVRMHECISQTVVAQGLCGICSVREVNQRTTIDGREKIIREYTGKPIDSCGRCGSM